MFFIDNRLQKKADSKKSIVGDSYKGNSRADEANQMRGGVWKGTAKSKGMGLSKKTSTFVRCHHRNVYLRVNFIACKL